jgi:hypothetical protein
LLTSKKTELRLNRQTHPPDTCTDHAKAWQALCSSWVREREKERERERERERGGGRGREHAQVPCSSWERGNTPRHHAAERRQPQHCLALLSYLQNTCTHTHTHTHRSHHHHRLHHHPLEATDTTLVAVVVVVVACASPVEEDTVVRRGCV